MIRAHACSQLGFIFYYLFIFSPTLNLIKGSAAWGRGAVWFTQYSKNSGTTTFLASPPPMLWESVETTVGSVSHEGTVTVNGSLVHLWQLLNILHPSLRVLRTELFQCLVFRTEHPPPHNMPLKHLRGWRRQMGSAVNRLRGRGMCYFPAH